MLDRAILGEETRSEDAGNGDGDDDDDDDKKNHGLVDTPKVA